MLRSLAGIIGYRIKATDDEIGEVEDVHFDDHEWKVRYVVVDTGKWLGGRKVLIAPQEIGEPDWESGLLPVALSTEKIRESPSVESDKPVSRRKEKELAEYFGWVPYRPPQGIGAAGTTPVNAGGAVPMPVKKVEKPTAGAGAANLRSLKEITRIRDTGRRRGDRSRRRPHRRNGRVGHTVHSGRHPRVAARPEGAGFPRLGGALRLGRTRGIRGVLP